VNREEKVAAVERLNETLNSVPHVILTSFRGLTVNQANDLRSRVREAGGHYTVIKNRLAKLAAAGTPMESLAAHLSGPCAMASHDSSPVALAKALSTFIKDNPQLEVVAGVVDAKDILDVAAVKQLALLPGMDELRAQLLALIQTPATTLVRLLATPGTQLARVVDAHRESHEGES
jgi:large subunit ribosomal protein L10